MTNFGGGPSGRAEGERPLRREGARFGLQVRYQLKKENSENINFRHQDQMQYQVTKARLGDKIASETENYKKLAPIL